MRFSEAWKPPQFEKKPSQSEKAILGATLRIPGHSRSNSRNGSHDLIYAKTLFIGVVPARQSFHPYGEEKAHKLLHILKLFSVTPVTGLRGRVPGQKELCSLGSEDST